MKKPEDSPRVPRDWVNTISLEHVRRGVEGGFTQADHGRSTRLSRLRAGDRIVFYSPRTNYPDGDPLQQFTACGVITGTDVYQVETTPEFHPWRREVAFTDCTPTPIRPLLGRLSFIPDERNWGFTFRRGLFQIPSEDFDRIVTAMGAAALADTPAQGTRAVHSGLPNLDSASSLASLSSAAVSSPSTTR